MKKIKLRIPLILLALSLSTWFSEILGGNLGRQNLWYLLFLILFVVLCEKSGLSERKTNIFVGILIAISGFLVEFLIEPNDYINLF